jgi:hypothetical protein
MFGQEVSGPQPVGDSGWLQLGSFWGLQTAAQVSDLGATCMQCFPLPPLHTQKIHPHPVPLSWGSLLSDFCGCQYNTLAPCQIFLTSTVAVSLPSLVLILAPQLGTRSAHLSSLRHLKKLKG